MRSINRNIIHKITDFAEKAHEGQVRIYELKPYIVHPVRVMNTCCAFTDDLTTCAAAILHDVLEDTDVSADQIKDFLLTVMSAGDAERTVGLVKELTDTYTPSKYPQFNRSLRKKLESIRMEKVSGDAQTIKCADIIDNCRQIVDEDPEFAKTYLRECRSLLFRMHKGDTELHDLALNLVNRQILRLEHFKKDGITGVNLSGNAYRIQGVAHD